MTEVNHTEVQHIIRHNDGVAAWTAIATERSLSAFLLLVAVLMTGCAGRPGPGPGRVFDPVGDGFAYANETRWVYGVDPVSGRQVHVVRDPAPEHTLRCFPMARAARQFFRHARFEPDRSPIPPDELERRIRTVLRRPDRMASGDEPPVTIPGYAGLADLSRREAGRMQAAVGGAWRSYVQRGHWRMVFPFSRRHQRREADRMAARIAAGDPAVVHVVRFPDLTLNHALVVHAVDETPTGRSFQAYDPNLPGRPVELAFDAARGRFALPALPYFVGGEVSVYEVYRGPFR